MVIAKLALDFKRLKKLDVSARWSGTQGAAEWMRENTKLIGNINIHFDGVVDSEDGKKEFTVAHLLPDSGAWIQGISEEDGVETPHSLDLLIQTRLTPPHRSQIIGGRIDALSEIQYISAALPTHYITDETTSISDQLSSGSVTLTVTVSINDVQLCDVPIDFSHRETKELGDDRKDEWTSYRASATSCFENVMKRYSDNIEVQLIEQSDDSVNAEQGHPADARDARAADG